MIHLIVLDTVEFGKVTFVIENISVVCAEEYHYTQICALILRDALEGLPMLKSKKEKGASGVEDICSGLTKRKLNI